MSTYIGIEGGGTSTRIMVQHDTGTPQYFEEKRSFKVRNRNFAESAEILHGILSRLLSDSLENISAIAIGLSGMSQTEDQEALKQAIHNYLDLAHVMLHVESDATLTFASVAHPGEPAILLIAGTGSVIFYQPYGGEPRRIGGWGPTLSDEGSGYRIGLRALRHYIHVLDGIAPPDVLSGSIANRLPLLVREDRLAISQLVNQDPSFVASLARDVLEAGIDPSNDRDVLRDEFIELILMIIPLLSPNVMNCPKPYRLYLSGSIAKHWLTIEALTIGLGETDVEYIPVEDHVPSMRALYLSHTLMSI